MERFPSNFFKPGVIGKFCSLVRRNEKFGSCSMRDNLLVQMSFAKGVSIGGCPIPASNYLRVREFGTRVLRDFIQQSVDGSVHINFVARLASVFPMVQFWKEIENLGWYYSTIIIPRSSRYWKEGQRTRITTNSVGPLEKSQDPNTRVTFERFK